MTKLLQRLRALDPALLQDLRRGIEKESLRVRPEGPLATTPHPSALGSSLTHAYITTDFSEAQLELITGVHSRAQACLKELTEIHQVAYRRIGDEVLWCASMPCFLPEDDAIPIAQYGSSNRARLKTVYRTGLSHRYGRRMQAISGIHYNFSLPDEAWRALGADGPNDGYFALIRNFRRHCWLILYLFGASPAVCRSFVEGRVHELLPLKGGTLYLPEGTSLRMGPLGYRSDAQAALAVSYNSLESYAASLRDALTRPYPLYEAIGIRDGADQYRQLATSLLQLEAEFYGTIRPKRRVEPGERPLHALLERGVEYVEVRLMDLDPFSPIGITEDTIRFLDMFLLHCVLRESPPDDAREIAAVGRNLNRVAARGRKPGLQLEREGTRVGLAGWGAQVLSECEPIAAALDAAHGGDAHRKVLAHAQAALTDPGSVPSARVIDEMVRNYDSSYTSFVLDHSIRHRKTLLGLPLSTEVEQRFEQLARQSLEEQRRMEAADDVPFETYRQHYLSEGLLVE